ncbi:MAG: branched-chain amino acid ABC transporter permease [Candidatus Omnitrophica bacterium]|nr:branched-chain amino acid ABC transporter permease [Candidatus Omnitrophota bacterium]
MRFKKFVTWQWAGVGMTMLALPLIDPNPYHLDVLTTSLLYALLALGLNIIVGLTGLLHLGYAAFFAIGAYTYGLLNLHWHWPFWIGWIPASLMAGVFGVLLGAPALRVRGDYLAIVTLGFGEIVRIAFTNLDRWTGGPNGLLGIAHPTIWVPGRGWVSFGVSSAPYYVLACLVTLIVIGVCVRASRSRIGRAWVAIRDDELAASCAGIPVLRLKLLAQGCGGCIAGLAGAIFAAKQGTITPDSFDFILSVMILAMVVLGGLGSIRGAVAGALILGILPELLRGFDEYRMLVFGLAMILMIRWRPQGLFGATRHRRRTRYVRAIPA